MDNFTESTLLDLLADERARTAVRKGYRLQRLEIKNFGGYHGPASVFKFDLQGAVFSGDNGAGKSTVVDGYRMLFRTHPRFNSATQEQSKDRTVETYYLGQYGKKDSGSGAKHMTLRTHGVRAGYMAVCGVFETDAGEVFSFLRMAYFPKKGDSAEWRLITARGDISIERDFPEWPTKGVASRAAEALNGELHSTFKDFFAAIGLAFGIDDPEDAVAAFRFIDESIGVKKMGSITGFARDNIFPKKSLKDSADAVITTFEEVRQSIQAVERCEAKIKDLTEVDRRFKLLDKALDTHEASVNRKARFEQFSNLIEHAYWARQMRKSTSEQAALMAQLTEAETQEHAARAEVNALEDAIRSNNFDKIDDYIADKAQKTQKLTSVRSKISRLKAEFKALGLNFRCDLAEELVQVRKELDEKIAIVEERRANVTDGRQDLERTLYRAEESKREAGEILASLLNSKTAIEHRLLNVRTKLAAELQMREDELPFLAELVQIREGEEAWEGVANRVLGGLGCEILVDAAYASQARKFINSGPAGAGKHNWGTKVILREIKDMAPASRARVAKTTLAGKLDVNPESAFAQVARSLVDNAATHECVSEAKFQAATGDACTKEGSVMRNNRLVKDDRSKIDDRSKYVLGWNIEDRIELARQSLADSEVVHAKASDELKQSIDALATLDGQRDGLNRLAAQDLNFFELDEGTLQREITALEASITALDSKEAQDMRRNMTLARKRETDAREAQKTLNGQIGAKTSSASTAGSNRDSKAERVRKSIEQFGPASAADRKAYREAARTAMKVPDTREISRHILREVLFDLGSTMGDIRRIVEAANNSELHIHNRANDTQRAADAFLREYTEEGGHVELDGLVGDLSQAESLARGRMVRDVWVSRLATLNADDLPRHKANFQERHSAFAKDTVETIKTQVNAYATRLQLMQEGLNSILKDQIYDPMENSRARLRIRPTNDNHIVVKFRARLDDAVKHIYSPREVLEAKTQRVIDMINDENTVKGEKQREAILDLTNWFEMDIEEYTVDENGDFLEQRRFWSGKDGESGGQGERLTMLLIGAGLAYTFGLHDETRASTGLQIVVLDEAFMHGSEEMAAAAMQVLGAMGLQVIAATPAQKLQAFAGHAERVFDISKRDEQIRHVVSTYAKLVKIQEKVESQLDAEAHKAREQGQASKAA